MSFSTKTYSQRLKAALVKCDKESDPVWKVKILQDVINSEIKLVEKIENMPGFRAWLDGEHFDISQVRSRK